MKKVLTISITSAVLVTLMLFYIDEGFYDLRWMKDIGNWIVFIIYVSMFGVAYTTTLSAIGSVSPKLLPVITGSRENALLSVMVCTVVGFVGSLIMFVQFA